MPMRLTPRRRTVLRRAFERRFAPDARLWLYGSRTDDGMRGGDIDLMVQTALDDPDALIESKLSFLADLHSTPEFDGEKIDLVLWSPALQGPPQPIHRVAMAEGMEL